MRTEGIFNSQNERLGEAFLILQIDHRQFKELHTKSLKIEYLVCKLVLFEFQHYDKPKHIALAQKAYQIILNSTLVQQHVDKYGFYSRGLLELDFPKFPKTLEPKDSGVGPGYIGHQVEDAIIAFFKDFPQTDTRLNEIRAIKGSLGALLASYQKDLPRYIVKLTYEVNESGEAVPNTEDLARSFTMQEIHALFGSFVHRAALKVYKVVKTQPVLKVNCDGITEALTSDLGRASGMEVHDQRLMLDSENPSRFFLKSELFEETSLLQPLAGSSDNQNYYVEPVLIPDSDVRYLASDAVLNFSQHFPIFACMGDSDKVGKGNNLLIKSGVLIGIDFGKAYPDVNTLVNTLKFDFTFNAPEFKNYFLFLDVPRSKLMEGVIKLARWANEMLDPAAISSYGEEFDRSLLYIVRQADESIFDDYAKKFKSRKQHASYNQKDFYREIVQHVEKKKELHIRFRNAIIKIFRCFLNLSALLVNTLQNFEKLWAAGRGNTSMRSPDGKVMLRHLRVTKNPVVEWKTDKCTRDTISVTAVFTDAVEAQKAMDTLKKHPVPTSAAIPEFKATQRSRNLEFTFPRDRLPTVAEWVNEDSIKARYHEKDYVLSKVLREERSFLQSLDKLKKYHLDFEAKVIKGQALQLIVKPKKKSADSEKMMNFIANGLRSCRCSVELKEENISVEISRNKLKQVEHFLVVFDACYQLYEKEKKELETLSETIKTKEDIDISFNLELIYHEGEFKFHLAIRTDNEDMNLDIVTEGNLSKTVEQLQSVKVHVLNAYRNYQQQMSDSESVDAAVSLS